MAHRISRRQLFASGAVAAGAVLASRVAVGHADPPVPVDFTTIGPYQLCEIDGKQVHPRVAHIDADGKVMSSLLPYQEFKNLGQCIKALKEARAMGLVSF